MNRPRWAAIVLAAGRGERLGRPKQFLDVAGLPMAGWSIQAFAGMSEIADLIVVTEAEWLLPMRELFERLAPAHVLRVVKGGATRQQSVFEGLSVVPARCDAVLVHDGARPLLKVDDVRAGMREVRAGRAALLAAAVVDTIKLVDSASLAVVDTLDRRRLWAAQTPQLASTGDLRRAHECAREDAIEATDDAALLERIGVETVVVPASAENFKVTLPPDLICAQALLQHRASRPDDPA